MKRWLTVHDFAVQLHSKNPQIGKPAFAAAVARQYDLTKARSIFFTSDFAIRFSYAKVPSFSNCVVSLAALQKFDDRPFLVCILRPAGVETFLANSTFIKKVSHSSHKLTVSNIRGTILGHDIAREHEGMANVPANFAALYETHSQFSWDENLARIVDATTGISPTGIRFAPTAEQVENILNAPRLSLSADQIGELHRVEALLLKKLAAKATDILTAAQIDNVKIRGDRIEQLLTGEASFHKVEDQTFETTGKIRLLVDLKTKMLDLASSPKLYNIDKTLAALADGRTVVCLFLIGVDTRTKSVIGRLIDIFDSQLLDLTRVQFHWAGRNSRGVTQMTGSAKTFLDSSFKRKIDIAKATNFLKKMLAA